MESLIIFLLLVIIMGLIFKDYFPELRTRNITDQKLKQGISGVQILGSSKHHDGKLLPEIQDVQTTAENKVSDGDQKSVVKIADTSPEINLAEEESGSLPTPLTAEDEYFYEPLEIGELQDFTEFLSTSNTGCEMEIMQRTARKIDGTELYELMESSIEGAAAKIAELLDKTFTQNSLSSIKKNPGNDAENFDISHFI